MVRLNVSMVMSSKGRTLIRVRNRQKRRNASNHTTKHDTSPIECKSWFIVVVLHCVLYLFVFRDDEE